MKIKNIFNKNNPRPDKPRFSDAVEKDLQDLKNEPSFDDLQPLFDDISQRLATVLDRPEAKPNTINLSASLTYRRRMLRLWIMLAVICIAFAILWNNYNNDNYCHIFTIFLKGIFVILSVKSILIAVTILRRTPSERLKNLWSWSLFGTIKPRFVTANFLRTVTIVIATTFTIVMVSCTTTIGDGLVLTQNNSQDPRIETVENVTYFLEHI